VWVVVTSIDCWNFTYLILDGVSRVTTLLHRCAPDNVVVVLSATSLADRLGASVHVRGSSVKGETLQLKVVVTWGGDKQRPQAAA